MCISVVLNFLESPFAWEFPNCLVMTQSGKSRQLSSSDLIGDHLALCI